MIDAAVRKSVRQQIREAGDTIATFQETCAREDFSGTEGGLTVLKSASMHFKAGKG